MKRAFSEEQFLSINKFMETILPSEFYQREDTLQIARELLGRELIVRGYDDFVTGGIITEVEAYLGGQDKGAHSYGYKKTKRNQVMFQSGGIAYVYFCYGMYDMFNIVTHKAGEPHAVLIRAIKPTQGTQIILRRRKQTKLTPLVSAGPGRVTMALAINRTYNGKSLTSEDLHILREPKIKDFEIVVTPRIGIAYAKEDAMKPYRFYIKGEAFVSKPLFPSYE